MNKWDEIVEGHNSCNFVKIIRAFDYGSEFWFLDLQEASGINSVLYFRRSLVKLVRLGVLVEVKRGLYCLDRDKARVLVK